MGELVGGGEGVLEEVGERKLKAKGGEGDLDADIFPGEGDFEEEGERKLDGKRLLAGEDDLEEGTRSFDGEGEWEGVK